MALSERGMQQKSTSDVHGIALLYFLPIHNLGLLQYELMKIATIAARVGRRATRSTIAAMDGGKAMSDLNTTRSLL